MERLTDREKAMKLNKKVLEMKYPPITSYQNQANLLALLTNHEQPYNWIYSNFIQLDASNTISFHLPNLFKTCPFIYYQRISRAFIKLYNDSVNLFFINAIHLGSYAYVNLNHYYIPGSSKYQKEHKLHDTFVFGYDLDEQVFYIADFFIGKYDFIQVTFSDFENAFKNMDSTDTIDYLEGVELLSYKETEYNFDINQTRDYLIDYLHSKPSYRKYNEYNKGEEFHGLDVYISIQNYLNKLIEDEAEDDVRSFHVLLDHKKIMLDRLVFLGRNNFLDNIDELKEKYNAIQTKVLICRNSFLKFYINKDKKILIKIIQMLTEIRDLERIVLEEIIERININMLGNDELSSYK